MNKQTIKKKRITTITKQIRSDWLEEREDNFNIQKKKKMKVTEGRELTDNKKMGQTRTNREESKTAETKEAKH